MARRYPPEIEKAIEVVAAQRGISPDMLRTFIAIESGGRPGTQTGSYKGLMQLSNDEFAKHGGQGNIFDPMSNLDAGAVKLGAEMADFERKFGRKPTGAELYMIHQQGWGGAQAHWNNPNQPAWVSMYSTGEGRQKGEKWAKDAIWGNVPDDVKAKFGSVENMTSQDFVNLWSGKYERLGGGGGAPTPEQRQGSINGGMGMSPTGVAGVAGPIQTQEAGHAVADQPAFKDFQTTVTPAPAAPAGGGGPGFTPDFNVADLAGALGQFGGKIGQMLAANAPKPPAVNLVQPAGPRVDLGTIMQVLARRQRKGNGNMGGGDYGIG